MGRRLSDGLAERERALSLRRRILVGVGVLVVLGVAIGAYETLRSRHSTPVQEQAAIDRFHALQGSRPITGLPAPGVYEYSVRGWECAGLGPLCLHRTLPSRAYAIVSRNGDQLTVEIDLSRQHLEAQRFRIAPSGRLLAWQRARISILGVTQDDAHAIAPPTTLALPARISDGRRWTQVFNDGGLPVRVQNQIARKATLDVGGRARSTWVVVSSSKTGGAHPGSEVDTDWHDPASGLDVRLSIDRRITGVFPYRLEVTGDLLSETPLR